MIKKLILFLLLGSSSLSLVAAKQVFSGSNVLSDMTFDVLKMSGASRLTKVVANELDCSGRLNFFDLTVHNDFTRSGSMTGEKLVAKTCCFSGRSSLQDAEIESLVSSGKFNATKLHVKKDFTVSGLCEVENLTLGGKLHSSGTIILCDSAVHDVRCANKARLYDTIVDGTIVVDCSNSSYTGWTTEIGWLKWILSWFVSSNDDDHHVLYLHGKTKVSGTITFKDGNGTVYCDKTAEVVGAVNGGKIIKK